MGGRGGESPAPFGASAAPRPQEDEDTASKLRGRHPQKEEETGRGRGAEISSRSCLFLSFLYFGQATLLQLCSLRQGCHFIES